MNNSIAFTFFKFTLFINILFILACTPRSKETYLKQYATFIERTSSECITYNDVNWKKADKDFQKFSQDWYYEFKDELTWKEAIKVESYKLEYNILKVSNNASGIIENLFKNTDKLRDNMAYYLENNMQDELQYILDEAEKIGGTVQESVEGILEEFEKKIKNEEKVR